ncbi:MAG TPA: RsmG family class I SAM-dependent methyltransferase [Microthrixaceae bacterium]|nr:RsmG family class I SAM-dependent methyltransferase [Microthrixaceae bacterium]
MSDTLHTVLDIARSRGFLGPGDVAFHVEHARSFVDLVRGSKRILDLGSGGGLPGLVMATELAESELVFLDANQRRTEFLAEAVEQLGLDDRASVVTARAEEAARRPELRGTFDAVVARSFGPPAVVAECGAPFLQLGGRLVVSEPPDGVDRWPVDHTAQLGLEPAEAVVTERAHLRVLRLVRTCPDRYPRRVGVPAKRLLF